MRVFRNGVNTRDFYGSDRGVLAGGGRWSWSRKASHPPEAGCELIFRLLTPDRPGEIHARPIRGYLPGIPLERDAPNANTTLEFMAAGEIFPVATLVVRHT